MASFNYVETVAAVAASGTAIANTVTETIVFPDLVLRANTLTFGKSLKLSAKGQYSTTGTPTLRFSLRLGGVAGTLLCKSAAIVTASGVTAALWDVEIDVTVQAYSASGTIMANGKATVFAGVTPTVGSATGAPAISAMTNGGVITPALATGLNLYTDQALSLTATWGAADPANTLTGLQEYLWSLT